MSYYSEVMADTPRAYWRMDEASGNIQDSSGNSQHAYSSEGTGSATYSQTGALASDLSSTSIRFNPDWRFLVADSTSIDLGDTLSIEFWVKLNAAPGTYSDFLAKQENAYEVRIYPDRTVWFGKSAVGGEVISTSAIPLDGNFHHVVCTKSGSTMALYLDNVDVTGSYSAVTFNDNTSDLQIGGSAVDYLDGWLDEIALYPSALTGARVSAHYTAATTSSGAPGLRTVRAPYRWG